MAGSGRSALTARTCNIVVMVAAFTTTAQTPQYTLFDATNNVYGRALTTSEAVALGAANETSVCAAKCAAHGRSCGSFVWHEPGFPDPAFAGRCFGTVRGYYDWYPTHQEAVTSGRMLWPCEADVDCSMNGACTSEGSCACRPGWRGHACEALDVRPVNMSALGLRERATAVTKMRAPMAPNQRNVSTWGGAVLYDAESGLYHMWASEIEGGCGVGAWCTNSRIVHATSTRAEGPYRRVGVVFERFAHEPSVARCPVTGRIAMFFTGTAARPPPQRPLCSLCADGVTLDASCAEAAACQPNEDPTWLSWSAGAWGPWSEPVAALNGTGSDTNFAPLILSNGSLLAMWRSFAPTLSHNWFGSKLHILTGSHWDDPRTYNPHAATNVLPMLGAPTNFGGAEDPFIFFDEERGVYHAILHNMYGCGTGIGSRPCGSHAFSRDGISGWVLTGSGAYGAVVELVAGCDTDCSDDRDAAFIFSAHSRERPHLIVPDGDGSPSHLVTGLGYDRDATFTLVQPLAR